MKLFHLRCRLSLLSESCRTSWKRHPSTVPISRDLKDTSLERCGRLKPRRFTVRQHSSLNSSSQVALGVFLSAQGRARDLRIRNLYGIHAQTRDVAC